MPPELITTRTLLTDRIFMAGYSSQILQMMQGERARDLAAPERGMQQFMGTASAFQNFRQQDEQMAQRNQELSLRERSFGQQQQQSDFQNRMALEDQKLQYANFGLQQDAHALDLQYKGYQLESAKNNARLSTTLLGKTQEQDAQFMPLLDEAVKDPYNVDKQIAVQNALITLPYVSSQLRSSGTSFVGQFSTPIENDAFELGKMNATLATPQPIPANIQNNPRALIKYNAGMTTGRGAYYQESRKFGQQSQLKQISAKNSGGSRASGVDAPLIDLMPTPDLKAKMATIAVDLNRAERAKESILSKKDAYGRKKVYDQYEQSVIDSVDSLKKERDTLIQQSRMAASPPASSTGGSSSAGGVSFSPTTGASSGLTPNRTQVPPVGNVTPQLSDYWEAYDNIETESGGDEATAQAARDALNSDWQNMTGQEPPSSR